MAYTNFNDFKLDFQTAYPNTEESQAFLAHCYYTHGLKQGAKSGLTIGLIQHLREKLLQLGSVLESGGQIFVDEREGKVNRWKIHHNDSFILGGIHSLGTFELVSVYEQETKWKETYEDQGSFTNKDGRTEAARQLDFVADPTSQYPLRVTQREVMALNIFGYIGEEQNGSMCFTLPEKNKPIAEGATLTTYAAEVKALVTALDPSKA
ncbi:MAG: hypothetical protein AAF726_24205 [Planctomycetota bacterium]